MAHPQMSFMKFNVSNFRMLGVVNVCELIFAVYSVLH